MKWNHQCLVYLFASLSSLSFPIFHFFFLLNIIFIVFLVFVFLSLHRTRVILLQVTSHWISKLMNRPSSCLLTGVTTSVRPITALLPWNHRPSTRISAKKRMLPIRRLTATPRPTNGALPCIIASSNLCSQKFWAKKKLGTVPSKSDYLSWMFYLSLFGIVLLIVGSLFLRLKDAKNIGKPQNKCRFGDCPRFSPSSWNVSRSAICFGETRLTKKSTFLSSMFPFLCVRSSNF